jgi:integrase
VYVFFEPLRVKRTLSPTFAFERSTDDATGNSILRDRKAETPAAANNRRKYLSSMFGWAVEHGLLRFNPAREVRKVRYASAGFHTWSVDEVRQFEERHPVGTKARLALALLLYLGVRRGDVVILGRQLVKDGWGCGWCRKKPAISAWSRRRSPSCRSWPTSSPAARPVTSPI